MKNSNKTKISRKLKAVTFTLSEENILKIEQKATLETRGNRSLWLDQKLSLIFAGIQESMDV